MNNEEVQDIDRLSYRRFKSILLMDSVYMDSDDISYWNYHAKRLFTTYNMLIPYLTPRLHILSIGAAGGGIERVISFIHGCKITVVNFEETLRQQEKFILACGFGSYTIENILEVGKFDIVLYTEVIEHIPDSPSGQIQFIRPFIKPGGLLVITTPNLGSISTIVRILCMKPLLGDPDKAFGEVNKENSAVRRREYYKKEVETGVITNGLQILRHKYIRTTSKLSFSTIISVMAGWIFPRFKPGQILISKND